MGTYYTGCLAENVIARQIQEQGNTVLAQRWRCPHGEVDIVSMQGDVLVFTEVKARRTLEEAAYAITPRQIARISNAAQSWLAERNESLNTLIRIDAALMDRHGRVEVIENAGFH